MEGEGVDYNTEYDFEPNANYDRVYANHVALFAASAPHGEPSSYQEAMQSNESERWEAAMQEEWDSLKEMGMLIPVARPQNRKVIGCKWVYKMKVGVHGEVVRYKARLVAKGYTQIAGMDYRDTHAPVTRLESLRTLLALAAYEDWEVRQIDVKTAYLYGKLEEEIYMEAPDGIDIGEGQCFLLLKALYGLKQAGRQWYQELKRVVVKFGLRQLPSDPHTYVAHKLVDGKMRTLILPVYVDDLLPIGHKSMTDDFEVGIGKEFQVTPACDASYVLGIRVNRDRERRRLSLDQANYANRILRTFIPESDRHLRARTPFPTRSVFPNEGETLDKARIKQYQSAIGALMYLMMGSRPDLAFALGKLGSFASNPSEEHIELVKRVFYYVAHTKVMFLRYSPDELEDGSPYYSVYGYSDSDFAEKSTEKRKSILGYVFYLGDAVTSWRSKKQETTATSTTEAEYVALYHACANALWLRHLFNDIGETVDGPISVNCDNAAAVLIASGEAPHNKVKHIETKYHRIQEWVDRRQVKIEQVGTNDNFADIMTKPLPRDHFMDMVTSLGLVPVQASPVPDDVQLRFISDTEEEGDSTYVDAEGE